MPSFHSATSWSRDSVGRSTISTKPLSARYVSPSVRWYGVSTSGVGSQTRVRPAGSRTSTLRRDFKGPPRRAVSGLRIDSRRGVEQHRARAESCAAQEFAAGRRHDGIVIKTITTCKVKGQNIGCQGSGFRVQGSCRVQGSAVRGSGCRVRSAGFILGSELNSAPISSQSLRIRHFELSIRHPEPSTARTQHSEPCTRNPIPAPLHDPGRDEAPPASRNATPPIGVTAPRTVTPLSASA